MRYLIYPFWNVNERRLRALWRIILQLVLMVVAVGLLTAVPMIVISLLSGSQPNLETFGVASLGTFSTVVTLVGVLLSMWLASLLLDRHRMGDFGFHFSRAWWRDLLFGLMLGAALMAGIFLVELAAGWISIRGTFETAQAGQPFLAALIDPIIIFLCVGIYEEALSRGYWLHNLSEGLNLSFIGPKAAILLAWFISSAVFGVAHMGNPNTTAVSTINLIIAGLFLGLGYILTGELAIPMGLHITWNFFQGNVFGFPVSGLGLHGATFIAVQQGGPDLWTGGAFGPEAGLMGIAAILAGSVAILVWVRRRHGRLALSSRLARPR
jgi:uncharacterized protein